jgi:outer membrane protein OmpA-like peptidoglycan-associated protein
MLFENMKISESFPLLNYIFFDKNSDEILSRYKHFSDSANIKGFSEEKIDGNAIDHYYHILNIFGKRLKENTSATITLIGNTDGTENNWEDLSLNRAKRIKKYFSEVWGIDPSRIQTLTGKLPGKPADTHIDEGKAENRRVECYSNNWEIVKPVTFTQDSLIVTPKVLDFKLSANNPLPIKKMTLDIFHDNIPWNFLQFNNRFDNLYQYNWRNKGNILPIGITQLDFRVKAFDNHGDSTISEISSLPIKEITTETIRSEKLNEKKLQKVSLILFDFDSYNTGERNETIMQEYVYPKLSDNTQYITVNGFTDNIGKPEYNLQLSTKRAEKISNMIGTKYPSDKIKFWGLGSQQPIYTNSLPEGRFYNRTVQIIFQNYKPW